ncbi:MAG: GNAT family N-acetyltransferase [Acidobacteria bacterium]|nr:GNAT family N-acetyltransferase [Acidobacteriota bacterium]
MEVEDLDHALRLSTIAGWNQQLDDWRMLLRLAPAGAFAAVADARIVGTAIGIDYGGFAWIAMMLVDPAYRGRGVARRLLDAAMGAVPPSRPIRLDATSLGRPLYEKCGFEDEATLSRLIANRSSAGTSVSEIRGGSSDVRPLTPSDLETVIERDRDVFGGTRGAVLEWAFHSAAEYAYVVRRDGVIHYCLGRHGRLFDQIGPVVASRDDIAQALVDAALAAAGDRPVVVDAFDSRRAFAAWLGNRGFVVQRRLVRMCRPAESGSCAIGAGEGPLAEFAILGPEFA